MRKTYTPNKFFKNKIIVFLALTLSLLTLNSCGKEKRIIGSWQRESVQDGAVFIECYKFSDDGEKIVEYSLIPTDSRHVGYYVKGNWEIFLGFKLRLFYDTATVKLLHFGFGSSLEELAYLAKYKNYVKSNLVSQNDEMKSTGLKLNFEGDDEMILGTQQRDMIYFRIGEGHKDAEEYDEEDFEEDTGYENASQYEGYDTSGEESYTLTGEIGGKYPIEIELTAVDEEITWARYRYTKTGSGDWIDLEIDKDEMGRFLMYEYTNSKAVGYLEVRFTVSGNSAELRGWHKNLIKDAELSFYADGYRDYRPR